MSGKVTEWLDDLGLVQCSAVFEENDISWELIGDIDQETLKDIGIGSAGHRLHILKSAKSLRPEQPASSASTEIPASGFVAEQKFVQEISGWSRTPGEHQLKGGCIMQRVMTRAALAALLLTGLIGAHLGYGLTPARAQSANIEDPLARVGTGPCEDDDTFAIVIHGGSVFWRGNHAPKIPFMQKTLIRARSLLATGARAIDVAEAVIASMENSGLYNAGKGAIANQAGAIELDASIMDGRNLKAGAVAAVRDVRNPIIAARLVMDQSDHVLMVGPNADDFVQKKGGILADSTYFLHGGQNFSDVPLPDDIAITPLNEGIEQSLAGFLGIWGGVFEGDLNAILIVEKIEADNANVIYALGRHPYFGEGIYRRLTGRFVDEGLHVNEPHELGGYKVVYRLNSANTLSVKGTHPDFPDSEGTMTRLPAKPGGEYKGGTVGAVVRDRCGDLAAGTSTGGFDSKTPGRVGDSPIIGAGTYADNETAAISATGHGEFFIRHVVAYDITAAMKYKGLSLEKAARNLIKTGLRIKGLRGGVIAVDGDGNFVMTYNTEGMVRGVTTNAMEPLVKVY